jgi:hypothetical protein
VAQGLRDIGRELLQCVRTSRVSTGAELQDKGTKMVDTRSQTAQTAQQEERHSSRLGVKIPTFDGEAKHWARFKMHLKSALMDMGNDMLGFAMSTDERPGGGAERRSYDQKNQLLFAKLALSTEGDAAELVEGYAEGGLDRLECDGKGALQALFERYEGRDMARAARLLRLHLVQGPATCPPPCDVRDPGRRGIVNLRSL